MKTKLSSSTNGGTFVERDGKDFYVFHGMYADSQSVCLSKSDIQKLYAMAVLQGSDK